MRTLGNIFIFVFGTLSWLAQLDCTWKKWLLSCLSSVCFIEKGYSILYQNKYFTERSHKTSTDTD